jgi:two-component system response regulator HydG
MEHRILIVDDNEESLHSLEMALGRSGYQILTATGGREAIDLLEREPVDVVVSDLRMPDVSGLEVLQAARSLDPAPAVILLTAYGTIESAVEALKAGAYNYLTKPVNLTELRHQVAHAMELQQLKKENQAFRRQLSARDGFEGIIGESPEIRAVIEQIRTVADTTATVLIEGESGTGKELVARAVHEQSRRSGRSFIVIHCGALCDNLIESELFGHEKGAFTGAQARKQGLIELADGGTLFLDEIGEIPLSTQVKLLRVLETKEFMRVGGVEPRRVDIRVVAATNRNLAEEVAEGRFREDLYYRLNVVKITVPPLRARRSDIPGLVHYFLRLFEKEHSRGPFTLTPEALEKLRAYHWPGNVRQMRNVIETLVLFAHSNTIGVQDLPAEFQERPAERVEFELGVPLDELERRAIIRTLDLTGGNRTKAAEILGISRRTLIRRLKELGVEV